MKREADGDMGSPHKRSRRGDEEVRLLIPSKAAGSIIGKGGSNISKLRGQYKASITIPDCQGPERMLSLSSDLDTLCNIIIDVIPNLESIANSNDLDLRMMIHQSQAGCVIGKAGSKIKEIREKFGTRIKVFSSVAPQSTDRIIQIIGTPETCIDTIREIILLTKQAPIKGAVNAYDPHNFDEFFAADYGGWGGNGGERRGGGGGGDRSFGGGRPSSRGPSRGGPGGPPGGRNNSFDSRDRGGPRPQRRGPPPGRGIGGNDRPGRNNMNRPSNGNFGNRNPNVWDTPSDMGRGPLGGSMPRLNQQNGGGSDNTTQVTIPKDLAGAIIGKGGGRIRKIRQDSGATIIIDEPLPGSNDRIISITGNPNQIQMAQYLLQQSVHNSTDRNF